MLCLQAACLGGQVAVTDGQELLGEMALDGQFAASWWSFYKATKCKELEAILLQTLGSWKPGPSSYKALLKILLLPLHEAVSLLMPPLCAVDVER